MTQIQEFPSKETQETPNSSANVQDKKNFAAMNGLDIELNNAEKLQEKIPQPEEIITTRTVSQNPVIKMGVIGGGILIFIMLIGGVINGSMNALKLSTTKEIKPTQDSQEVVEDPVKDEAGKDKTALALTSQSTEMKKMRDLKATPEATVTPSPSVKPVSAEPTPTTPAPQRTVVQKPTYRRIDTPPAVKRSSPQPQSKPIARVIPATPNVNTKTVDPMQKWLAVANIGSFSTNDISQAASDNFENAEGIEGGTGTPKSSSPNTDSKSKKTDKQTQDSDSENNHYGQARILVGTRAEGRLETPIAWSRNSETQSNQSYLIQLSKPLKTSTGSEALPKGSYIVAQIQGSNQSEYIQLQAVSALVNKNGDTEEHNIPEGTVLILAKNGKLLKAESRKGSDLGRSIFSSVLAGVAKAAEIQNRPNSQISTNSNGFSSSTITNDNKDLLAGLAEGTLGEMVRGIQANNQRQNQHLQSEEQVFVIEAGKQVQIFVNQTILL